MSFNSFSGFVKYSDTEPFALNLSVKAGASEELCFTSEFRKLWYVPTTSRAQRCRHLPMEKPFKTLASHPVYYEDTFQLHTELRCCCCCLHAGEGDRPVDTAPPASSCPNSRPTAGAAPGRAQGSLQGGSLLDHNQILQVLSIGYCQRVCDLRFTTEVTVNIHSGLKKCWSLCQERKIKTETTECRPKVGGSGERFNEKSIKFSSYFYSQPGRNTRSRSFFPYYMGLPTATEASFKVEAKTSCLHYFSWCFSLRWFCFKLWTQTSCLQCFPFSASVCVSCKWT